MALVAKQQNLKVSQQYINWILATNRGIMGHLYAWTSLSGETDYFTDLDIDITYDNVVWKSGSLRFEGLQRKVAIGTNVDEQSLKIWAAPTDTMFGGAFLEGAQQGLLDGASVVRYRAIWPFVSGNAAQDVTVPVVTNNAFVSGASLKGALGQPLAVFPLFTGYVSSIDKGGASHVELKVKSALMRLAVNMPRNYYQPGCLWTLYDSGCGLNKATYATTGVIGSGSSTSSLNIEGGVPNPVGPDGISTYCQGRILFTSGVNEGLLTICDANDALSLHLAYPLDELPAVGDTITYYYGCSKSFTTCQAKFGNQVNFRGFDKVPPIYVSL